MRSLNAEIRPFGEHDDIGALTALLHRAYAPLAERGMRYVASWQGDEITRKRVEVGECFVAELDGNVVGTISFHDAARTRGCSWFDRPDVASFHQFAVEPELQGAGLGGSLLMHVEKRAVETGAQAIALDTSEHAADLIAWYQRRGYVPVDRADWESTNYVSVILSKPLQP